MLIKAARVQYDRGMARYRLPLFVCVAQMCVFACSAAGAFLLRFDFEVPPAHRQHLAISLAVWMLLKPLVFQVHGLNRYWWRHSSFSDVLTLCLANAVASGLGVAVLTAGVTGFPRSVYILDFLISLLFTAGLGLSARALREVKSRAVRDRNRTRALIYGAGRGGQMLLREIRSNPALAYDVCGFIDDDPANCRLRVHGVSVLGGGAELGRIAASRAIQEVLIAIPSASGAEMTRILNDCHSSGIRFKTVPGLAEVISGNTASLALRDVAVEDLLGRKPVRLEEQEIRDKLQDRVVLVTGAAGSIGSELCRQIARYEPLTLVGLEVSETGLFHLEREMRRRFPHVRFVPEIGSVQNTRRLAEVFEQHRPAAVFHAAAYKHVPLMEAHLFEAVENNVFGTLNVATAAKTANVEDFVMISSDKAVRPTNIMGATKRLAELVIHMLQNGGTKFVSVRFGNVLGSNGSVVPLFKEQIAAGGPITVTHPEMRRYFMTIPEAAQLVLQASTMSRGGETFVLDMGEPVRIVDLATNLILLSGLRPETDIPITFCGARPGEKLYEELHGESEETLPTFHEKIRIFTGSTDVHDLDERLRGIRRCCETRDYSRLVLAIKEAVPEYNPSAFVLRRAFEEPAVTLSV